MQNYFSERQHSKSSLYGALDSAAFLNVDIRVSLWVASRFYGNNNIPDQPRWVNYPSYSQLNGPRLFTAVFFWNNDVTGFCVHLVGRSWATDGTRKSLFFLFGAFWRLHVCNVEPQTSNKKFSRPLCLRSKSAPKKEIFDFRLPSVAHDLPGLRSKNPGD